MAEKQSLISRLQRAQWSQMTPQTEAEMGDLSEDRRCHGFQRAKAE